jgi:hypothetical protein
MHTILYRTVFPLRSAISSIKQSLKENKHGKARFAVFVQLALGGACRYSAAAPMKISTTLPSSMVAIMPP